MIPKHYYSGRHWIAFSKGLLDDKDVVCDICHRPRWKLITRGKNKGSWKRLLKFAVHHKHYETVYKEKREDVLLLCSACHTHAHDAIRARNASPFHEKLARLFEAEGFIYKRD